MRYGTYTPVSADFTKGHGLITLCLVLHTSEIVHILNLMSRLKLEGSQSQHEVDGFST